MCRLAAITATIFDGVQDKSIRQQLLHEMMLRTGHEDGGQRDGWGVSDGKDVWKSAAAYNDSAPTWLSHVNQDADFMIGHIRKASPSTGRTIVDSHPYILDVGGQTLIAAHNGFMEGPYQTHQADEPNTDTWRALKDLKAILQGNNLSDLTTGIIEEWLSAYYASSHFAFFLLWKGLLHVVRGNSRPMHLMQIGNGFLLNTSSAVLDTMKLYFQDLYGMESGNVLRINDNVLLKMKSGDATFEAEQFDPKYAIRTYPAWQSSTNYPKAGTVTGTTPIITPTSLTAVNHVGAKSEESGADEIIIAPSVTAPRRVKVHADVAAAKKEVWNSVAGELSPLRMRMSKFWAASLLGYSTDSLDNFVDICSLTDLRLLREVLFLPLSDGTRLRPFNSVSNLMISWWNRAVKTPYDVDAHVLLFGQDFFWLDPDYTQSMLFKKTQNAALVLAQWQADVMQNIGQTIPEDKVGLYFNIEGIQ